MTDQTRNDMGIPFFYSREVFRSFVQRAPTPWTQRSVSLRIRLVHVLIFSFSFVPSTTWADLPADTSIETIEHNLIHGCEEAEALLKENHAHMSSEERLHFTGYLKRILQMKSSGEVGFHLSSSSQPTSLTGARLAETLDPNLELNAKKCALRLITYTLPESARLIAQTNQIGRDAHSSRELIRLASEASFELQNALIFATCPVETELQALQNLIATLQDDPATLDTFLVFTLIQKHPTQFDRFLGTLTQTWTPGLLRLVSLLAASREDFRTSTVKFLQEAMQREDRLGSALGTLLLDYRTNLPHLVSELPHIIASTPASRMLDVKNLSEMLLGRLEETYSNTRNLSPTLLLSQSSFDAYLSILADVRDSLRPTLEAILRHTHVPASYPSCQKEALLQAASDGRDHSGPLKIAVCENGEVAIPALRSQLHGTDFDSVSHALRALYFISGSAMKQGSTRQIRPTALYTQDLRSITKLTAALSPDRSKERDTALVLAAYLYQGSEYTEVLTQASVDSIKRKPDFQPAIRYLRRPDVRSGVAWADHIVRLSSEPNTTDAIKTLAHLMKETKVTKDDVALLVPLLSHGELAVRMIASEILLTASYAESISEKDFPFPPSSALEAIFTAYVLSVNDTLHFTAAHSLSELRSYLQSYLQHGHAGEHKEGVVPDQTSESTWKLFALVLPKIPVEEQKFLITAFGNPREIAEKMVAVSFPRGLEKSVFEHLATAYNESGQTLEVTTAHALAHLPVKDFRLPDRSGYLADVLRERLAPHAHLLLEHARMVSEDTQNLPLSVYTSFNDNDIQAALPLLAYLQNDMISHAPPDTTPTDNRAEPARAFGPVSASLAALLTEFPPRHIPRSFVDQAGDVVQSDKGEQQYWPYSWLLVEGCKHGSPSHCQALQELFPRISFEYPQVALAALKPIIESCASAQSPSKKASSELPPAHMPVEEGSADNLLGALPTALKSVTLATDPFHGKKHLDMTELTSLLSCPMPTEAQLLKNFYWQLSHQITSVRARHVPADGNDE